MDFFRSKKDELTDNGLADSIITKQPMPLDKVDFIKKIDEFQIKSFYIETTCGTFHIYWKNKERLSPKILSRLWKALRLPINSHDLSVSFKSKDHSIFEHLFRYIQYGIEINVESVSKSMGLSQEDIITLVKDWGYTFT